MMTGLRFEIMKGNETLVPQIIPTEITKFLIFQRKIDKIPRKMVH